MYLKALSQLVEIEEATFPILDDMGKTRGSIAVDVFPEGPDGEELDYVMDPNKIIGQVRVLA